MGGPVKPRKIYFSYDQIHNAIKDAVMNKGVWDKFKPTMIVAIGGGGFIPARVLRTFLKQQSGKSIPIQAIGLILYNDDLDGGDFDPSTVPVRKTQWLNYRQSEASVSLQGHNILIVDEVDDSRKTLSYAVAELQKDIEQQRKEYEKTRGPGDAAWQQPNLGVFVVHNKLKTKGASLPKDMLEQAYFSAEDVPDQWLVYPWDAHDIDTHTEMANNPSLAV